LKLMVSDRPGAIQSAKVPPDPEPCSADGGGTRRRNPLRPDADAAHAPIPQSPLPSRPIDRGRPGSGLLAHVLVSKYADHLPLCRQSQIVGREGLALDRSTLADWVGKTTASGGTPGRRYR